MTTYPFCIQLKVYKRVVILIENNKKKLKSNYLIKLKNQDCLDYCSTIESNTVDLIIADPPYYQVCGDFDFDVFQNRTEYLNWCRAWLLECKRILTNTGTLILWGGVGPNEINIARLAILIEDEELLIRQNWITQRNTRGYGSKKNYMSAREDFLFLTKTNDYTFNIPYTNRPSKRTDKGANGKPRTNQYKRVSNVWDDITEASQSSIERCGFPTVKSLKLCDRIIQTHSNKDDRVYIPFVGSGSEVVSSLLNQRQVEGTELSKDYFEMATQRIDQLLERFC